MFVSASKYIVKAINECICLGTGLADARRALECKETGSFSGATLHTSGRLRRPRAAAYVEVGENKVDGARIRGGVHMVDIMHAGASSDSLTEVLVSNIMYAPQAKSDGLTITAHMYLVT
jgi:hypothetical protein